MTPEELLKLATDTWEDRHEHSWRVVRLAEGYIALSVKLEEANLERDQSRVRHTVLDEFAHVRYVNWADTAHAESIGPNVLLRLTDDGRVGGITVMLEEASRGEVVKATPRVNPNPEVLSDERVQMTPRQVQVERGDVVEACPQCWAIK